MKCKTPGCPNDAPLVQYAHGGTYQRKYCDDHSGQARVMSRTDAGRPFRLINGHRMIKHVVDGRTIWVGEHREVMASLLGRTLRDGEHVFHKNDDKLDNRPENLLLRTKIDPSLLCPNCLRALAS